MESSSWTEGLPSNKIKAIQELTNGHILTDKLREMIGQPEKIESDLKSTDSVVVQILGMFDNTLSILRSSNLNKISHNPTNDMFSPGSWDDQKQEDLDENIKPIQPIKIRRGCYKRRYVFYHTELI